MPQKFKCPGAYEAWKKLISVIKKPCLAVSQLLLLSACVIPPPVEIPMPLEFYPVGSVRTDELVVFLPGRGDEIDAFQRAGFIETLQQSERPLDAVVAGAHLGYYYRGVLADRVHLDILAPYQEKGYRIFIIVGTSLGGYGALWVNHEYSDLIRGVVLLAPYLGKNSVIKKIEAAGSLDAWRSQLNGEPGPDEKVWLWVDDLKNRESEKTQAVILAVGNRDKFSEATELLSKSIPESRLFLQDGSHNWNTWHALWVEILNGPEWKALLHSE